MYDIPSLITGCKRWSKNSETFSVGVPQFEKTRLLGMLLSLLCTFGKRYNLPKLVLFLKLNLN